MSARPQPLHIRIFLSSPGDVADERKLAIGLFDRLQYDPLLRGRITIEAVAWDKPGGDTPLLVTMTPQEAINQGLPKPSDCDVVVVIFWARMGTPLPDVFQKLDGSLYLSGTEWEYEDAVQAARKTGKPLVVVYRRAEKVAFDPADPAFDKKVEQWRRVDNFFAGLMEHAQGFNSYQNPSDFEEKFETHLKVLIKQLLDQVSPTVDDQPAKPLLPLWEGSPFPGLRAYTPADASIYFGRGAETDALIKRLSDSQTRLVAIVGASGSGKSSLVGAGLIPRLASGAVEGSQDWLLPDWKDGQWVGLRFTPGEVGDNPFMALAVKLAPLVGETPRSLADALAKDTDNLETYVAQVLKGKPAWAEVLLFIDQFEELFSLVNPSQVVPFINLLKTVVNTPRVRTLITLRADFYARCVEEPELAALLKDTTYPLAAPLPHALGEMITRPAERAALEFEAGLSERILRDTGTDPGALALMAYALDELYHASSDDKLLTHAEYDDLEGVQGAIGKRAENTFARLDAEAQNSLPDVFSEICEVDERGVAIRRRASLSQTARTDAARRLVEALTNARLLVQDINSPIKMENLASVRAQHAVPVQSLQQNNDSDTVVEVAHEALLRSWTRLVEWIEATQDDLRLLRQVRIGAEDWLRSGSDTAYLLSGTRLERARAWVETNRLSDSQREFIQASLDHQKREREERRDRERRLSQARFGLALAIALVALLGVAFFLIQNQTQTQANQSLQTQVAAAQAAEATAARRADEAESIALAGQAEFVAPRDPFLAYALALEAVKIPNPPVQSQHTLASLAYGLGARRKFAGHTATVNSVAFSSDGKMALSGSDDNTLTLWNVATGETLRIFSGHTAPVNSVAFSPNGRMALSGSYDNTLILWDVETGEIMRSFRGHTGRVNSVAFSPDGRMVLSGSDDSTLRLSDVASGAGLRTFRGHTGPVYSVAFSPDGRMLLSGSRDNTIILWDVVSGEALRTLTGHTSFVNSVTFSPDAKMALSGSFDNTLILWDVTTGQALRTFIGHTSYISSVAFSPDGKMALSGSNDNTLILWDVVTGEIRRVFHGHINGVENVAFSPDGKMALSGSRDSTLILWDVEAGDKFRSFTEHRDALMSIAFSPDGKTALSGSRDSTLILWDVATEDILRTFSTTGAIRSVAFSPDGKTALSGSTHNIILWDIETGEVLHTLAGHTDIVTNVAFSPDGKMALSLSNDAFILWDLTSGQTLYILNGFSGITDLAFSPDGKTVLYSTLDSVVTLLDIETGYGLRTFRGHIGFVNSVAFSPDGKMALSGSDYVVGQSSEIILWDVVTGEALHTFSGHTDVVNKVMFSPDGKMALSGSEDGTIILWDLVNWQLLYTFSGHTAPVTSVAFSPDGKTVLSGSEDGTMILWRIDTLDELIQWTYANREVPELTCQQRQTYNVQPLCAAGSPFPTRTPYLTWTPSPTITPTP